MEKFSAKLKFARKAVTINVITVVEDLNTDVLDNAPLRT
jgi:hypothetical protein